MKETHFPPALQRLRTFLERRFGPADASALVTRLLGDASTRQYFRHVSENHGSRILALYPEPFDPECFPYRQIHQLFQACGLPVPQIFELDGSLGIVLLEDLGDESLQQRLHSSPAPETKQLLQRAVGHIVTIQQATCRLTPQIEASRLAFDEEKLHWELDFFRRYYLRRFRDFPVTDSRRLQLEFQRLASRLASLPRVLCHRDYHVRNIMLKKGQLYLIDFQDARLGPCCYDLVSLLQDSVSLPKCLIDELIEEYLNKTGMEHRREDFRRDFEWMTIQRLLKALGTYGYQVAERGNQWYRQYVRGSLERILPSLQEVAEFPYIQSVVEEELKRFRVG